MRKEVLIADLPTKKENTFIEITINYQLGGMNYFTYKDEPRGYYIGVSPVTKERGWRSFTAFSGIKHCIKPVSRFSAKTLEKLAGSIDNETALLINDILSQVQVKNGLELTDEGNALRKAIGLPKAA